MTGPKVARRIRATAFQIKPERDHQVNELNPVQKIQWLQTQGLYPVSVTPGAELMAVMADKAAQRWNQVCPAGTAVKVYRTYGEEKSAFLSTTRSAAWVMGGHMAVVKVEGEAGGYALTHLVPYVSRSEVSGQANLLSLEKGVVCA